MIEAWRLARLKAGDPATADWFVRTYYPQILRYLEHLTGSRDEAQDLAQQTFVNAHRGLPDFRGGCRLGTWLHRVATHEYLHWLRDRKGRNLGVPEPWVAVSERTEDALILLDAIQSLSEDLKQTFLLREVQQLSVRETAAALGIPEGTVKSRCAAARSQLRESLAGIWEHNHEFEAV